MPGWARVVAAKDEIVKGTPLFINSGSAHMPAVAVMKDGKLTAFADGHDFYDPSMAGSLKDFKRANFKDLQYSMKDVPRLGKPSEEIDVKKLVSKTDAPFRKVFESFWDKF